MNDKLRTRILRTNNKLNMNKNLWFNERQKNTLNFFVLGGTKFIFVTLYKTVKV